jgi:hypothetical protein
LTSPGNTISCGPGFVALVYTTSVYIPLSAAAFASLDTPLLAVGEGLELAPHVGGDCAQEACCNKRLKHAPPIPASRLRGMVYSP